jgi:hypothetical protein
MQTDYQLNGTPSDVRAAAPNAHCIGMHRSKARVR